MFPPRLTQTSPSPKQPIAIVTHKGAAADAGHYIGYAKKSVFHGRKTSAAGSLGYGEDEDDEDWYKFDDEKVSLFPKEKLATLDGGGRYHFPFLRCFRNKMLTEPSSPRITGEDSSAYVLLYRTKPLA